MSKNLKTTVLLKVQEIAQLAFSGNLLFRGEPENYPRVCSSLFREFESLLGGSDDDVTFLEDQIVNEAKSYTTLNERNEILTELQHFGHFTNLIDFTSDYNVSLFFASDGGAGKNGRVIFLEPNSDIELIAPINPANRVLAQKSIFVRSPKGFVEPTHVVDIPSELKAEILNYLRVGHGITTSTIYNDLHGFIRQQAIHQNATISLFTAFKYLKEEKLDEAEDFFGRTIKLRPNQVEAYLLRAHILSRRAFQLSQDMPQGTTDSNGLASTTVSSPEDLSARANAYVEAGKADLAVARELAASDSVSLSEAIEASQELLDALQSL